MTELIPIPATALGEYWSSIGGHVAELATISNGRLLVEDIIRAIARLEMQLWAARDDAGLSVMLTEILVHPRQKDAHIISATGHNAERWTPLWPMFERWAKAEGCDLVTATCRKGWKKLLEPIGFSEASIVLEKRL